MTQSVGAFMGSDDQAAYVSSSTLSDGAEAGSRVIDVHPMGGLHCRLLVDRGLDIGPSWFRGYPLDWRSPVGFPSASRAAARPWLESFGGGLMVSCGPDNVGPDCVIEGREFGLHGSHSSSPASRVSIRVDLREEVVIVTGRVRHASVFGANLIVARTIRISIGRPKITLRDVIVNEGVRSEPLMLLYHMNFGHPLTSPTSRLVIPSTRVIPRDDASETGLDEWDRFREPDTVYPPQVFEHQFDPATKIARAVLVNPAFNNNDGIAVRVSVDRSEMPRLWQWRSLAPDVFLTGIEPANCGILGRHVEGAAGEIQILEPGEIKECGFVLEAAAGTREISSLMNPES